MITAPTHKRRKSPYKHSKTISVFTSGQVIITVQIHSKNCFSRIKMTTARWTINTEGQQDLH